MSSSGSILRPMSPGLLCKALQPLGLLMEKDLDDIHQGLSQFRHEIVCAMSSKAIFQTDKGDIIPDIGICYYWCSFCRFNTDEKQKLEEHVLTHRFSCRYCSFQAFSRVDICRHGLKAHDDFRKVAHEYKWCTILSDFLQYDKRDSDTFPETVDAGKASPGADAGKASPGADADCSIVRIESAYPRGGGSARGRRRLCGRMFPNSSVVVLDGNSQSTNTQHVSSLAGKDSRKPSSTERTVGQYPKPVNNNQSTHDATITLTPKPVNDHRSTHDATITLTSKPVNENQPTHEVGVTHTPEPVNDGQSTHEAIVTDTEVTSDASQPPMEATPVDGSKPAAQPAVNSTLADSSQPVKDYTPARNSKPSQSSSVPKQCKAGLVWGCPRCDFLTTVWRFAQEHVKLVHRLNSGPLTKDDITNKIVTAAKMKQILQLDKDRAASGRGIQSTPGTEKDAANQDCTQKKAVKQEGEDKDVKPMSAHLLNGGAEEGDSSSQESADYLKCIHCQVRLSSPTLARCHHHC